MPLLNHLANKVKHKLNQAVSDIVHLGGNENSLDEEEFLAERHRFDSFAPIRHEAMVKYFIDGHDYCW
jgi:phospholipase D1/2